MNEKRYDTLVTWSIYLLRAAMIVIAVMIPVALTVHESILNRLMDKVVEGPITYYVFKLAYCEIILGYLLSMFLEFREKKIFNAENALCLRRIGQLIILEDFAIIPVGIITQQGFTINLNVFAWVVGYLFMLLGDVFKNEKQFGSIVANSKAVSDE